MSKESLRKKDYIEFNMVHLVIFLTLFFHIFSLIYWEEYKTFIDENLTFIFSEIEMFALFIIVVVIPICCYFIYIFVVIAKNVWEGYTPEKIKIFIIKLRRNYVLFGFLIASLTFITQLDMFHWIHLVITISIIILVNVFSKKFKTIELSEININEIELSPIQILGIFIFIIALVFYFGNSTLNEVINETYSEVSNPLYNIILISSLVLAFFWSIVKWIASVINSFLEKYKEAIFGFGKFIMFAVAIYFFSKMIIFNLPRVIEEPYPTIASIGVSGITTLITRNYNRIKDWYWGRKNK